MENPTLKMLERMPTPETPDKTKKGDTLTTGEMINTIAGQAAALLGYVALQQHLETQASAVQKLLRELDMEQPYTSESVAHYKAAVLKAMNVGNPTPYILVSGILLLTAVVLLFVGITISTTSEYAQYTIPCAIAMWVAFFAGIVVGSRIENELEKNRYTWERIPLRGYEYPVPMAFIVQAGRIIETLQARGVYDVDFFIDQIGTIPDPFLVMRFGKNMYHLQVWDEPTFEGARISE